LLRDKNKICGKKIVEDRVTSNCLLQKKERQHIKFIGKRFFLQKNSNFFLGIKK